jgi:hypothetical protein
MRQAFENPDLTTSEGRTAAFKIAQKNAKGEAKEIAKITKRNDVAFRRTLSRLGLLHGQGKPIQELTAKMDYTLFIDKFQAKYFSVKCAGKIPPLFVHVLSLDEKNQNELGLSPHKTNLEVFWGRNTQFPNIDSCEGC